MKTRNSSVLNPGAKRLHALSNEILFVIAAEEKVLAWRAGLVQVQRGCVYTGTL